MRFGAAAALLAMSSLLGTGEAVAMADPYMDVPSMRYSRGGRKEHSNRHTGQAKIRREAKRLRNKKRRRQ